MPGVSSECHTCCGASSSVLAVYIYLCEMSAAFMECICGIRIVHLCSIWDGTKVTKPFAAIVKNVPGICNVATCLRCPRIFHNAFIRNLFYFD